MVSQYGWCHSFETIRAEGKDYCVFHSPVLGNYSPEQFNTLIFNRIDNEKKLAKEFDNECDLSGTLFKAEIKFSRYNERNPLPIIKFRYAEFNEFADFSEVTFGKKVNFSRAKFKKGMYFDNTIFKGKADFIHVQFDALAEFSSATFEDMTNFTASKFSGYSYFNHATFIKEVNFNEVQFSKNAYFVKTHFIGGTNFMDANFIGPVDFRNCTLKEISEFIDTKFNNETNFSVATFDIAIFTHSKFNGDTYFIDSIFGQETDFSNTRFNEDADFNRASFDGTVNFSFARFHKLIRFSKGKADHVFNGEVSFVDIIIRDKLRFTDVNLSKVSFLDSDIKKMDFISCTWGEKKGRYVLYDEIKIFKNKNNIKKDEIKRVEALYRRLKQKYKEEHNEPEVSNWHYCEKEMQKAREKRRYINLYSLYYISSGYGEKPLRAFIILFLIIAFFTLILNIVGVHKNPVYCNDSSCIDSIHGFSMKLDIQALKALILTTFQHILFVKTPDYIPTSYFGKFIVLLFSKLVIPLQAALFAFSLRNRFRR